MPPDPPRLGVLRTPSLSTFINHHASKGPLLVVKKNPPFKLPGYGPAFPGLKQLFCLVSPSNMCHQHLYQHIHLQAMALIRGQLL